MLVCRAPRYPNVQAASLADARASSRDAIGWNPEVSARGNGLQGGPEDAGKGHHRYAYAQNQRGTQPPNQELKNRPEPAQIRNRKSPGAVQLSEHQESVLRIPAWESR
jgi:hypothetical protein